MANRTVALNSLAPGTSFMIQGTLTFSRITSRIEGEELKRRIDTATRNGWIPVDKPHTTASISNARVVYANVDANGNPISKTPAEIYAEESLYQSRKDPSQGLCYTGNNKGNQLPTVGVLSADRHSVDGIIPEHELANGLNVTLVMRVFKPKTQRNNGVSLEGIIVNEPIRYFDNNAISQSLEAYGLAWNPAPVAPSDTTNTTASESTAATPTPSAPTASAAPFGQPVSAPQGNPYSTQGVPNQNGFMNPPEPIAAAPAPAAASGTPNPTGFQGSESAGIHYNPTDRRY